jgi:protein gp37
MADHAAIEWTDATWNPIVGCKVLSAGCAHCYAMTLAGGRMKNHPTRAGLTTMTSAGPVWNGEVRLGSQGELTRPLRWRRPRKIFVCAHGDLFYDQVPLRWIDNVVATMALRPQHTFQVLTKRPERMRAYFGELYATRGERLIAAQHARAHARGYLEPLITALSGGQPLPNVWLGVSAEDQEALDERVRELQATPAAIRFLSLEPLIAPTCVSEALDRIDWVILGGESGPKARPMHPNWARHIRAECSDAGVAFFFKQWGEWSPAEHSAIQVFLRPDGSRGGFHEVGCQIMSRVGKRDAGHVLDGQVHHAFPKVSA